MDPVRTQKDNGAWGKGWWQSHPMNCSIPVMHSVELYRRNNKHEIKPKKRTRQEKG